MLFQKPEITQTQNQIKMVKLKNGSEVAQSIVVATMMSLEALINSNRIAFYELVEKCRDSKHEMFGNTKEVVAKWALICSDGSVHSCIKDVVLSAVEGDGL